MTNTATFFKQVPDAITINHNWSCRPSEPENAWKKPFLKQPATVDSIVECLKHGPFVAMSKVGPEYYSSDPEKFNKQIPNNHDVPVYGWRADATRKSVSAHVPIIVCGVKKREGNEHLYFVRAQAIFQNPHDAIEKIAPHSTDKKVYVAAVSVFANYQSDAFPPVSEEEMRQYRGQEVVPTLFAGRPDLVELHKAGKLTVSYYSSGS